MGFMEVGQWHADKDRAKSSEFVRKPSRFRSRVASGGDHTPDTGRYHLYVSQACPWASRAIIVRRLKKLEDVVSMTVVHPDMLENGWTFQDTSDPINGFDFLYQVYSAAEPTYSGRVTVPVLWDRVKSTIVSNESAEIVVMLNREFDQWADRSVDLYPDDRDAEIDDWNDRIYEGLNNAVYRAGFATTQPAYQKAIWQIFSLMDELEDRLSAQRFMVGSTMSLADVRLFTTAVRFDSVYYGHFKCNVRHWWDYPALQGWLLDMYQIPGIADTVDLDQTKRHYYGSQLWVNPSGVIAAGPSIDLRAAHHRAQLS